MSTPGDPNELTDFDRSVLAAIESKADGITQPQLSKVITDQPALVRSLNKLIQRKRRVEILQEGGKIVYKAVAADTALKLEGLVRNDLHVLQQIEKAHNRGIWIKDLRRQTGLQAQTITKILKRLKNRMLIKEVKSKAQKQRKLYMLFDVEPSRELTGGAMYTTDTMELDHEFIRSLRRFVVQMLKRRGEVAKKAASGGGLSLLQASAGCTRRQLQDRLNAARIATVELGPEEMQQILDTLEFDGRIQRIESGLAGPDDDESKDGVEAVYVLAKTVPVPDALSEMPCGVCPVFDSCTPEGVISPATCVYLDAW